MSTYTEVKTQNHDREIETKFRRIHRDSERASGEFHRFLMSIAQPLLDACLVIWWGRMRSSLLYISTLWGVPSFVVFCFVFS